MFTSFLKNALSVTLCVSVCLPQAALASLPAPSFMPQPKLEDVFASGLPLNEPGLTAYLHKHPDKCQGVFWLLSRRISPADQASFYGSFLGHLGRPSNTDQLMCRMQGLTFLANIQAFSGTPARALASYDAILKSGAKDASPAVRSMIRATLLRKALILQKVGKGAQALLLFRHLADSLADSDDRFAQAVRLEAFESLVKGLVAQGSYQAGVEACDAVLDAPQTDGDEFSEQRRALALYFKARVLAQQAVSAPAIGTASSRDLTVQALKLLDTLLSSFARSRNLIIQRTVGLAGAAKASLLVVQNRRGDAVSVLDALISAFATNPDPALQSEVANAYGKKTALLREQRDYRGVIETFQDFGRTMGPSALPQVRLARINILEDAAWSQNALGHKQDALDLFDEAIVLLGRGDVPEDRQKLALLYFGKCQILEQLGRKSDAFGQRIAFVRDFYTMFPPGFDTHVLLTIGVISRDVSGTDQFMAARSLYDDLLRKTSQATDPLSHTMFLEILYSKAVLFENHGMKSEAISLFDDFIAAFKARPDQYTHALFYLSYYKKGHILAYMNQHAAAIALYNQALSDPVLLQDRHLASVADTILLTRSFSYSESHQWGETVESLKTLMDRQWQHPYFMPDLLLAVSNTADALNHLHRPEEALELGNRMLERVRAFRAPFFSRYISAVMDNMADSYIALNRPKDALATYDALIGRFANNPCDPAPHFVARAFYRKAVILRDSGRQAEADAALDALIRKFQYDPEPDVHSFAVKAWDETHPHPFLP